MRINSSRKFRQDNDLEHKARIMLRCLLYIMLQNSSSPSQSSDWDELHRKIQETPNWMGVYIRRKSLKHFKRYVKQVLKRVLKRTVQISSRSHFITLNYVNK